MVRRQWEGAHARGSTGVGLHLQHLAMMVLKFQVMGREGGESGPLNSFLQALWGAGMVEGRGQPAGKGWPVLKPSL